MHERQSMRGLVVGVVVCAANLGSACADRPVSDTESDATSNPPTTCPDAVVLAFVPDTGGGNEAYACFGFDPGLLAGRTIGRIAWTQSLPPFVLHHAKLYAIPGDAPDGPVACSAIPTGAVGLHVWAPGGDDLILPPDTGLQLPAGTRRLVVEAHALRVGAGAPQAASVTLCPGPAAPTHLAATMSTSAPVPAIRPLHVETSTGTCTVAGDLHLFSVWPHMHVIGKEIAIDLLSTGGTMTPLVDVTPWAFLAQRTYPLEVDARAGDSVQTRCTWDNTGDSYVLPGLRTEDEMCNAALIVWPAANATCTFVADTSGG